MLAFILISGGILAFAGTYQLLALGHQPAALVPLFLSLPITQQIAWLVIGLAPISLMLFALVQHCELVAKRKAAEHLATRLRGVNLDVLRSEQEQQGIDRGAEYLGRSDPEGALNELRERVVSAQQLVHFHEQRNQSGDLVGCVEGIRQQQQEVRQKLGDVIAKRRSIDASIFQLQRAQEEMEQSVSVIEETNDGETLERRLQKLAQFMETANMRCAEIERCMPGLLELEQRFEAIDRRLLPLAQKETGVNGALKALAETRKRLSATISRLELDEGVTLADRIHQLTAIRQELEDRVSGVLAQFSEIETIHRDITGLFVRLNQGQRIPRELDAGGRVVSLNG